MRLSGLVVRNENHGRYVPDADPRARLRLTGTSSQSKEAQKNAAELNLHDFIGGRLSFECQGIEGSWVCGLDKESMQITAPSSSR
jgi:hypothetical protein